MSTMPFTTFFNRAFNCILWEWKHLRGVHEEHSVYDTKRENEILTF